jgi:methionine-S-sulfoxide reductase
MMTTKQAIFAGGCFWCTEAEFSGTPGVISVTSGYTGGQEANPTYEDVSTGETGHAEAIRIEYDPAKVAYEKLLDIYWRSIDPTDAGGQMFDRGPQYRTAIFYTDGEQKTLAERSKRRVQETLGKPVVTDIIPASEFYAAEEYHQRYAEKNPIRYNAYKIGSGRPIRLKSIWKEKA